MTIQPRDRAYKAKFPRITEVSGNKGSSVYQFKLITNYDQRLWPIPGEKPKWPIMKCVPSPEKK